ncbi:phosphatidylglycerol lysyltransferase domain-containing protein [Cytobacillus spongiae]|uniref:phosphatidylglycerol lysyltransferase domain-containing protein n=1 Tax=Cytobacillus spongiae TaxID=2901381 RepID=UPI001F26CDFA|nr:phosphatidylglycerol lysyltransferase domain-containing protein [Cytobacillus spongiae]UII57788.1 phosphatidylglycerol lysyltransferase domain-containing protein [Cytobacillus spongiae]
MLSLFIILFISFILGIIFYWKRESTPAFEERDHLDEVYSFMKKNGGTHNSHLVFINDKQIFWTTDKKALIVYKKVWNKHIVLGDPICHKEKLVDAIEEFRSYSQLNGKQAVFYQVSADSLDHYSYQGLNAIKLGEEAKVNLLEFSLAGKKGAKLRTRKNKFERNGFQFQVIHPPYQDRVIEEIQSISNSWLGKRKEKGFSVGFFCEKYVSRFPLAILTNTQGEKIAFATLACDHKHVDRTITIDLMRYEENSPHGTMDFLFLSIFQWCKENGYDWCSMGMAPLSNVGTCKKSSHVEKACHYIFQHGNQFYNFKGLQEYKNKFFPNWEARYLVYEKSFLPILFIQIVYLIHQKQPKSTTSFGMLSLPKFNKAG